jgi:hypothetical protein
MKLTIVLAISAGGLFAGNAWAGWSSVNSVSPQYVDTKPVKGIAPGVKVAIHCKWKTVGKFPMNTDWAAYKKLKALDFKVPAEITLDGKVLLSFEVYVTGADKVTDANKEWIASHTGTHTGACSIDPKNIVGVQGTKTILYQIEVDEHHVAPVTTVGDASGTVVSPHAARGFGNSGPVADIPPTAGPDLTATNNLNVGGKTVSWGGEVLLNADQAVAKYTTAGGQCAFHVTYTLRNQGLAPSGSFMSRWTSTKNIQQVVSLASLAPGATQALQVLVKFSSGAGSLGLAIDSSGAVSEINEKNNQFGIRVTVNGSCMPGAR